MISKRCDKDMRFLVSLPDDHTKALDEIVRQGASSSRNALIQQIVAAFISDLRNQRPQQNPNLLQSAFGALVGGFLFGLGLAAVAEIFSGDE